ncbi:MAG: secretin N-terminal domain-containing protein [Verrucomicrobiia bacterium]
MKTKILIATLLGCLAWQQGALSQTDTIATNPATSDGVAPATQPASAAAANATAAPATTGTDAAAATPTAPAVASASDTPAATSTNTAATAATSEPPATASSNDNASAASPQPAAPPTIPLIQFQDVPITTAIENLARQAGINYLIDPKIGYGQPDQNGVIKPEPTLSIRWENVTAEQALTALLDNYGLQLVSDRKSQIARISTKDPSAPIPLVTRVVQLKYASTSNMVDSITASFTDKRSKVLPDVRTSQLVVVSTESEQEAVDSLLNQLDKPTRQVLIETKLVQISTDPKTSKGVDWSGTLAAQHVTFGNGLMSPVSATTTTIPGTPSSTALKIIQGAGGVSYNTASGFTPGIGFLNADGASAVLSFLNSTYDAQITSTPRVVTLDNETAHIEVTRSYPIINLSGGTANNSGSSSITYSNVGTILDVTPRISANDFIWLKVLPVVSDHFGDVIVTVSGGGGNGSTTYPVPLFDYRKLDSQAMIPNGDTLVMGGMVNDNPTETYTKVPVLGDIPGLKWAFSSQTKETIKDNLIIFLTPTIIKDSDFQLASSANTDFLKSKPTVMKGQINPNSYMDGAEPHGDWSNPNPVAGEYDKK